MAVPILKKPAHWELAAIMKLRSNPKFADRVRSKATGVPNVTIIASFRLLFLG
jgi:hypothetical protein